jgi:hypothetical protein
MRSRRLRPLVVVAIAGDVQHRLRLSVADLAAMPDEGGRPMSHEDHNSPQAPDDAVDAALSDLLAGVSPVNMVHGAIDLDGGAGGAPRPSQAAVEAARNDIFAALWGHNH